MEFAGTDLDSGEMVKEICGNYKVKGKGAKNSNSLVVASSSGQIQVFERRGDKSGCGGGVSYKTGLPCKGLLLPWLPEECHISYTTIW